MKRSSNAQAHNRTKNIEQRHAGQVAIALIACVLIAMAPYLVAQHLNFETILQIPAQFLLIAQICPIILCLIVFVFSRIQEKNDLKLDDEA